MPVTGFEGLQDSSDAPYYRSELRRVTPDQTWAAIHHRLVTLLDRVDDETSVGPIRMSERRIVAWHRALFGDDFRSAGVIRETDAYLTIRWREGEKLRTMQRSGTKPREIRARLAQACEQFNAAITAAAAGGGKIDWLAACDNAARLYARILAIHPFEDGNGRAAFVALQAALRSQGSRWVHFDGMVHEHDEALGPALRPGREDYKPFRQLLVRRLKEAAEAEGRR